MASRVKWRTSYGQRPPHGIMRVRVDDGPYSEILYVQADAPPYTSQLATWCQQRLAVYNVNHKDGLTPTCQAHARCRLVPME